MIHLLIATVIGCTASSSHQYVVDDSVEAQAAKNVRQIIAHRGASAERPECTLSAVRRAIEVGSTAIEIDVRTSRDGRLFLLHDATLDRTTNGEGPARDLSLEQLQQLDAGSWFAPEYRDERIPSLIEVVTECKARVDLLLDLKEQGDEYDRKVAETIREYGDAKRTILGVRSVAQAERFRSLLPQSRQLALIPALEDIEAFAEAGVDTIRLWPRWLDDGDEPVKRIKELGKNLHLNGTTGDMAETLDLLAHHPDSLLSDDPARLIDSLQRIAQGDTPQRQIADLVELGEGFRWTIGESSVDAKTFLNRDYRMMKLPDELRGMPRIAFDGGQGARVSLEFTKPAVVFATFEYNDTGLWSFEDRNDPAQFGWHLWRNDAYQGSSNPVKDGEVHFADIWFREYEAGQRLETLPAWWLCLGIVDVDSAKEISNFQPGLTSDLPTTKRRYSHAEEIAKLHPLRVPEYESEQQFKQWQSRQRQRFVEQLLFRYDGVIEVSVGAETEHQTHLRREYLVTLNGKRLFRFFRLAPNAVVEGRLPTIVCFMGHGKIAQILDDEESYQHACAKRFVEAGYLVYAMENIGMEPGSDTHLDLDQSLRLEGQGWYHVLFAHQRVMLESVFADPLVDPQRVGTTGVSTGGLLALSAAVIEPRIAAASVQGIFGSMRVSFVRDRHRHCTCGAIPGLLPDFDLPELALLVAPRPLHISNGRTDGFSPDEARRCVDLIGPFYERAGGEVPVMNVSSGGHEYAFDSASEFFSERLARD